MGRKTSPHPTRIWSFWCHGPVKGQGDELLADQLRAARVYKNKLIEIEHWRRKEKAELEASDVQVAVVDAKIGLIDAQIKGLYDSVSGTHQEKRTRKTDPKIKDAILELRKQRSQLYKVDRKEARAAAKTRNAEELEKIKAQVKSFVKSAYKVSPVFWGTKNLIRREVEQASGTFEGPQFRRWQGQGRVGVQFQYGAPISTLFSGTDSRMRIVRADPTLPQTGKRPLDSVQIKLAMDEEGKSVWVKLACLIHREFPTDARVQWAWIRRYKVGPRTKYELSLVLEAPSFAAPSETTQPKHLCAIDVGWRRQEHGLRYAYLHDGGDHRELVLPLDIQSNFEKANSLRSIRDRNFNDIRKTLLEWLERNPNINLRLSTGTFDDPEHGPITKLLFDHLADWKSSQRLAHAVRFWKTHRVSGDEYIFGILEMWAKREHHLYLWESGAREATLNARKDIYRKMARTIATTYAYVALEDFDLRSVTKRQTPENREKEMHQEARSQRFQVAVSEFRQELEHQCAKHGTKLIEIPAEMTTLTCHHCGHAEKWDKAPSISHMCEKCRAVWDQDHNAAVNIYRNAFHELHKDHVGL